MKKITLLLKCSPYILIALLAGGIWWYRSSASDWHNRYDTAQTQISTLQQTNTDLAAANAAINARNKSLVDSLDARTAELKTKKTELATARRNYRTALDTDTGWSRSLVPAAVANSLHTPADLPHGTSTTDHSTERAD